MPINYLNLTKSETSYASQGYGEKINTRIWNCADCCMMIYDPCRSKCPTRKLGEKIYGKEKEAPQRQDAVRSGS